MKKILFAAMAFSAVSAAHAVTLYQWDFNSNPNDNATTTGSDVADIAVNPGSAVSRVGGTNFGSSTNGYTAGTGSSDPQATDNTAYQLGGFPLQSTGSGTAGMEVVASTAGYKDIKISFDRRHSASASRWIQLQYSTDGTNFTGFQDYEVSGTTLVMINGASADLSSVTALNNNPNAKFRLVAIFGAVGSAGGTSYATVGNTSPGNSTYSSNGTVRYDMLTITGTAVPEPATMTALALGAAFAARRRKK